MKFAVIIPARYASSRFPGKPLAMLGGKAVINRVIEQVSKTGLPTIVATDDTRIFTCVEEAGGHAVMTRTDHICGTDRVNEAAAFLPDDIDVIINVQGDEPFIRPEQLTSLMRVFEAHPDTDIATLVRPLPANTPYSRLCDPALVKVVMGDEGEALYFSRFPIPYQRNVPVEQWSERHTYMAHIGIYAYRRDALKRITAMPPSTLEQAESLEQLRWLQAGLKLRVAQTQVCTIGIDTPQDLAEAEKYLSTLRCDSVGMP